MKNKIVAKISLFIAMIFTFPAILAGCDSDKGDNEPDETDVNQFYTIQYYDDMGIQTLDVRYGELYHLDRIPEKKGYEFMGLYDAETGGTQFVTANGSSVTEFKEKRNLVLYPRFTPKEYTLVLDYQGAAVTGSRSMTVQYDSLIEDLPRDLTMENKDFVGWFTKPDKQGIQVADQYGTIPSKNIVDESVFDLSDPKGYIYLYAGFKGEEFLVTFIFDDNIAPEEVMVEYGTPVSEVNLTTRVDGKAVISWSKKPNDTAREEIFNGKITGEMVLYATEWAPVIDFDSNGGEAIGSVVARSGDKIVLPTPSRENYKFVGWQTASGEPYSVTTMPTDSIKLKAKWQAMILFETNGGTEIEDISEPQGTRITLPESEKAGFLFAGWYTTKGEKYSSQTMPAESIVLRARWYVAKTKQVVFIEANSSSAIIYLKSPTMSIYSINFFEEISEMDWANQSYILNFEFHVDIRHAREKSADDLYATKEHFYFYSQKQVSDAYKLGYEILDHGNGNVNENYQSCSFSMTMTISTGMLYIALGSDKDCYSTRYYDRYGMGWQMSNFYVDISYPDTSKLY